MRKVIVLEFITLDGVIQAGGGPEEDTSGGFAYGGWQAPYSDDVLGTVMNRQMNMPFDLLLGRTTFEIWASYWPHHADVWRASIQQPSTSPRIPSLLTTGSPPCF